MLAAPLDAVVAAKAGKVALAEPAVTATRYGTFTAGLSLKRLYESVDVAAADNVKVQVAVVPGVRVEGQQERFAREGWGMEDVVMEVPVPIIGMLDSAWEAARVLTTWMGMVCGGTPGASVNIALATMP